MSQLGSVKAFAQSRPTLLAQAAPSQPAEQTAEQAKPSLRNLLDSVLERPTTAPLPAESGEAKPLPVPEATEQPVKLRLSLGDRKVYVYKGDTVEASFPVAIGKPGWETPTGEFEVTSQINGPGWTSPFTGEVLPPGPDSPLGDRWIGFWTDGTDVIGFHGTPTRDSVGKAASHGCVRMYNEDIRKMYDMVSLGTPVVVEP
ncbi:MAG: L,D-transpeptidase [Phormidesmis sp.]